MALSAQGSLTVRRRPLDGKDGAQGKQGESAYTLLCNTPTVSLLFTPNGENEYILNGKQEVSGVTFTLQQGDKQVSGHTITYERVPSSSAYPIIDIVGGGYSLTFPDAATFASCASSVTFTATIDGTVVANTSIVINRNQRGFAGNNGSRGRMPIPYGTWDKNTTYTVPESDTITPVVLDSEANNTFYALELPAGMSATVGVRPSKDKTGQWKGFDMMAYVWSKVLMADFATLADFVFYRNLMYSNRGLKNGTTPANYEESDNNFDIEGTYPNGNPIYRLSGKFLPNTLIDAYTGSIACNKFSEHYQFISPLTYEQTLKVNYSHRIDLSESHNAFVKTTNSNNMGVVYYKNGNNTNSHYICGTATNGAYDALLTVIELPKYDMEYDGEKDVYKFVNWNEDGVHVMISNEINSAGLKKPNTNYLPLVYTYPYNPVLVAAEIIINNNLALLGEIRVRYAKSYMIWKGRIVFGVLLNEGTSLKLRGVKTTNEDGGERYDWIIENSSDFEPVPVRVTSTYTNNNESYIGNSSLRYSKAGQNGDVVPDNEISYGYSTLGDYGEFTFRGLVLGSIALCSDTSGNTYERSPFNPNGNASFDNDNDSALNIHFHTSNGRQKDHTHSYEDNYGIMSYYRLTTGFCNGWRYIQAKESFYGQ